MKTATTLLFALASATAVAAHGILQDMTIDGKFIKGNGVGGPASPSGIRQVFSQDPIKGANNRDTNCGVGAKPAALNLDAMPGSELEFNWRTASGGQWPHNIGPMATYLASCGSQSCDKFDAINAKWFKVQQAGRRKDGTWAQQDLMNGGKAKAKLPDNLAAGNYLVRHEIIALHLATSRGGAEFYAGCAQLRVGGSETGVPPQQEVVSIPGAYSDNDPGIFDPDVFNTNSNYVYPGPPVATLVSGDASPTGSDPAQPSETSDSGSCRLRKRSEGSNYRPRKISRVMRNVDAAIH